MNQGPRWVLLMKKTEVENLSLLSPSVFLYVYVYTVERREFPPGPSIFLTGALDILLQYPIGLIGTKSYVCSHALQTSACFYADETGKTKNAFMG
jgi:hypothetical protein